MKIFLFLSVLSLSSCNQMSAEKKMDLTDTIRQAYEIAPADTTAKGDDIQWEDIEVMDYREIKYQGKLTRYFSVKDFKEVFGQIDSLSAVSADAPCNDGLFWYKHDGSLSPSELDQTSQYWFKNGSKYERFADSVAVDNFKLSGGNFVLYKGVRFDEHSTVADFEKLFPKAVQTIGDLDVHQEGILQVMYLKEDVAGISDGHLNVFFKQGKFYMIHHWFPC